MIQSAYELAKKNYGRTWTIEMLQNLVNKGKLSVGQYVEITQGNIEDLNPSLDMIKEMKIAELSQQCEMTIVEGVELETSQGVEHFSLEITDQLEITNQYSRVLSGATEVLYHADGQVCRMFSAQEITMLATVATNYVTSHRTYFNLMRVWVNRSTTIEAVNSITYGIPLPKDLDDKLFELTGTRAL